MIIFIGVDCGMFGSRNHRDSSVRELPTGVPRPAQRAVRARGFAWSPSTSLYVNHNGIRRGAPSVTISALPFQFSGDISKSIGAIQILETEWESTLHWKPYLMFCPKSTITRTGASKRLYDYHEIYVLD